MPPHCDSLDGPVVTAARRALDVGDVELVLPFVSQDGEGEVRTMFDAVLPVRDLSEEAREVADRLFFETVVRVHRSGEGAPYTGLKPAGLDVGPVIPLAERAIDVGSPEPVAEYLTSVLREQLKHRLDQVNSSSATRDRSLVDARAYVSAMLGFEVYAHHLFQAMHASAHEEQESAGHQHGHDH